MVAVWNIRNAGRYFSETFVTAVYHCASAYIPSSPSFCSWPMTSCQRWLWSSINWLLATKANWYVKLSRFCVTVAAGGKGASRSVELSSVCTPNKTMPFVKVKVNVIAGSSLGRRFVASSSRLCVGLWFHSLTFRCLVACIAEYDNSLVYTRLLQNFIITCTAPNRELPRAQAKTSHHTGRRPRQSPKPGYL